ncbi:MAG: manganese efflux pump MntP family protein [Pseudobdellovibrionaceae bacterium]|jgi:putative Mn2+ efflux pump MntP|nr:manganese efflux pump MntP family protein [Pseudobdellovibrionaceae bacterium]
MSADAFAASIGKGTALQKPHIKDAARIGMIFGVIEAITPIIGWLAGAAASSLIASIDHWIAFTILSIIGSKMLFESFKTAQEEQIKNHKIGALILTAIGTSIDALAVGATLAFLNMNIWLSAFAIGMATFLMATIGIMTGHYIGSKGGKIAEAIGGLGLFAIGIWILIDHLGA